MTEFSSCHLSHKLAVLSVHTVVPTSLALAKLQVACVTHDFLQLILLCLLWELNPETKYFEYLRFASYRQASVVDTEGIKPSFLRCKGSTLSLSYAPDFIISQYFPRENRPSLLLKCSSWWQFGQSISRFSSDLSNLFLFL